MNGLWTVGRRTGDRVTQREGAYHQRTPEGPDYRLSTMTGAPTREREVVTDQDVK
jgi:hypothetical protein